MARTPQRSGRSVLLLVVAALVTVLVAAAALVYRDNTADGSLVSAITKGSQASEKSTGSTQTAAQRREQAAEAAEQSAAAQREARVVQAVQGREAALKRLAKQAQALSTARPVAEFRFAQFNVQGASHRGNVGGRTRGAVTLLERYGATVAAVQEFAPANRGAFASIAGGWTQWPGGAGRSIDAENSMVWKPAVWEFVKGETRPYPYFGGAIRNMPRVLLRHRASGVEVWFASYHNPATCCGHGNAAGHRARAVSSQAADANALRAATKEPLIVAGDMNDRATYFCSMASRSGMHSADGSTYSGGCRVAARPWIDWIMGTPDVAFSGYVRDNGGLARASSDHPILVTTVKATGNPGDALDNDPQG